MKQLQPKKTKEQLLNNTQNKFQKEQDEQSNRFKLKKKLHSALEGTRQFVKVNQVMGQIYREKDPQIHKSTINLSKNENILMKPQYTSVEEQLQKTRLNNFNLEDNQKELINYTKIDIVKSPLIEQSVQNYLEFKKQTDKHQDLVELGKTVELDDQVMKNTFGLSGKHFEFKVADEEKQEPIDKEQQMYMQPPEKFVSTQQSIWERYQVQEKERQKKEQEKERIFLAEQMKIEKKNLLERLKLQMHTEQQAYANRQQLEKQKTMIMNQQQYLEGEESNSEQTEENNNAHQNESLSQEELDVEQLNLDLNGKGNSNIKQINLKFHKLEHKIENFENKYSDSPIRSKQQSGLYITEIKKAQISQFQKSNITSINASPINNKKNRKVITQSSQQYTQNSSSPQTKNFQQQQQQEYTNRGANQSQQKNYNFQTMTQDFEDQQHEKEMFYLNKEFNELTYSKDPNRYKPVQKINLLKSQQENEDGAQNSTSVKENRKLLFQKNLEKMQQEQKMKEEKENKNKNINNRNSQQGKNDENNLETNSNNNNQVDYNNQDINNNHEFQTKKKIPLYQQQNQSFDEEEEQRKEEKRKEKRIFNVRKKLGLNTIRQKAMEGIGREQDILKEKLDNIENKIEKQTKKLEKCSPIKKKPASDYNFTFTKNLDFRQKYQQKLLQKQQLQQNKKTNLKTTKFNTENKYDKNPNYYYNNSYENLPIMGSISSLGGTQTHIQYQQQPQTTQKNLKTEPIKFEVQQTLESDISHDQQQNQQQQQSQQQYQLFQQYNTPSNKNTNNNNINLPKNNLQNYLNQNTQNKNNNDNIHFTPIQQQKNGYNNNNQTQIGSFTNFNTQRNSISNFKIRQSVANIGRSQTSQKNSRQRDNSNSHFQYSQDDISNPYIKLKQSIEITNNNQDQNHNNEDDYIENNNISKENNNNNKYLQQQQQSTTILQTSQALNARQSMTMMQSRSSIQNDFRRKQTIKQQKHYFQEQILNSSHHNKNLIQQKQNIQSFYATIQGFEDQEKQQNDQLNLELNCHFGQIDSQLKQMDQNLNTNQIQSEHINNREEILNKNDFNLQQSLARTKASKSGKKNTLIAPMF